MKDRKRVLKVIDKQVGEAPGLKLCKIAGEISSESNQLIDIFKEMIVKRKVAKKNQQSEIECVN